MGPTWFCYKLHNSVEGNPFNVIGIMRLVLLYGLHEKMKKKDPIQRGINLKAEDISEERPRDCLS